MRPNSRLMPAILLALRITVSAAAEDIRERPSGSMETIEVRAGWGPRQGPDGKSTSANTAVIPDKLLNAVLMDGINPASMSTPTLDQELRQKIIELIRANLGGLGPSAGFQRYAKKDGKIEISNPRTYNLFRLIGAPDAQLELGVWQASATKTDKLANGYRWQLAWMLQIRLEKVVKRYRIDVDLTGTVDSDSGGIRYQAIWKGPFREKPINLGELRKSLSRNSIRTKSRTH